MGAGAALSTAAMAHGGATGMSLHQQTASGAHSSHAHAGPAPGVPPPGSFAALAADVVDKGQQLTARGVRAVASLPIVGIDLYGDGGEVAAFPAVDEDGPEGKKKKGTGPRFVTAMGRVGANGTDLVLKCEDDASHRAVRKLLAKGTGYETVFRSSVVADAGAADGATITKPHLLLGARRTSAVDEETISLYKIADDNSGAAIAEESAEALANPVTVRNGTLDGGTTPNHDDFDRVAFHLSVHSGKKGLTMLPEEAVGMVVTQAKRSALRSMAADLVTEATAEDDEVTEEDLYLDIPTAVPIPAWACSDGACEAVIEACGGRGNVMLYQRSVSAVAGSLLFKANEDKGEPPKLLQMLVDRINTIHKERQKREAAAAAGTSGDGDEASGPTGPYHPLVIYAGATDDGLEITAVQLSEVNDMNMVDGFCPFGDVKVISSVAYKTSDPIGKVGEALLELTENIDENLPELFEDDKGPAALVTYGTIASQVKMKKALTKALAEGDEDWSSAAIPFHSTREECAASGAAVLAAVSHGRVTTVVTEQLNNGKSRAKGKAAVVVHNVACSAVGMRYNYFGGKKSKWSDVKVIFDFDRRVPAGPYEIEFSAAESAAMRAKQYSEKEEEALLEATKKLSGAKNIPVREEAALDFRIQIVQRMERDGGWVNIGNVMKPLTVRRTEEDDEGNEVSKEEDSIACESSAVNLSVNPIGIITVGFTTDGESIAQANTSARNSKIRYYVGIAFAILFFGGFMVKSYVEEKIFERDVERLLTFYKHAAPGTIHDGDENNARWQVYKYRKKKEKLWRRLEVKYGMEVLHSHEWPDLEEEAEGEGEEEVEEMDIDEDESETSEPDL